jgi:cellulose synthase/poly-beta-1,6-N-acetylglucosamine synthase-like glycosyltransferase
MVKKLTLSLIIPCYDEEEYIGACLDSIARQSVKPDEVFVINNNSSDKTKSIAKRYKFAKIIDEKRQGLIPARNKGFAAAKGDILARTDADAELAEDWVEKAKEAFADPKVDAVGGAGLLGIDPHLAGIKSLFWSRVYYYFGLAKFRFRILWGPNMAIRRSAWEKIKRHTAQEDHEVHEDQDLSLLLNMHGMKILYLGQLVITTDMRRYGYLPKMIEYTNRAGKTKKRAQKIRANTGLQQNYQISPARSLAIYIMLLPFSIVAFIMCVIYTLECWLGLRRRKSKPRKTASS